MIKLAKPLILASQSPRRKELLKAANIPFVVKVKSIDESFPAHMPRSEVAPYIAERKALAASIFLEDDKDILLTADSVVVLNNEIFNKPQHKEEALEMLRKLSGSMHTVYTGVCLQSLNKKKLFCGASDVYMNHLSTQEVKFYVENFKPFDKAGAYAIQEWIGMCKINRIDGTYSNIMGLPVNLVYDELLSW